MADSERATRGTSTEDTDVNVSLTLSGEAIIVQQASISVNGDTNELRVNHAVLYGDLRNDSYGDDYHRHSGADNGAFAGQSESALPGSDTATCVADQLTPGQWYQLSTTWDPRSYNSGATRVAVLDGDTVVGLTTVNQQIVPNSFSDGSQNWQRLGIFQAQSTSLSVRFVGQSGTSVVVDAVHLLPIIGDPSLDDDYRLSAASPAIDHGDPDVYHFLEPRPNGGRVNVGASGGTSAATTSPAQVIQVLSPGQHKRATAWETLAIHWRSNGLTSNQSVLQMNLGNASVPRWGAEAFQVGSNQTFIATADIAPDVAGLVDPAPAEVYRHSILGGEIDYLLPVPNGIYTVRMHFMEPTAISPKEAASSTFPPMEI